VKEDSDIEIKRHIKRMLNGGYINNGFWNGKHIRIKRWLTGQEYQSKWAFTKFMNYGVFGQDPVTEEDDNKIIDYIFKEIKNKKYFSRSPKDVQLFLAKIHEDLVPMMIEREGHRYESNYIQWNDFKDYIDGEVFVELLENM